MNFRWTILTVLFIFPILLSGQGLRNDPHATSDSIQAVILNKQAHEAFDNDNMDQALTLAENSLLEVGSRNNHRLNADNLLLIANIYRRQELRDKAVNFYIRAVTEYEKLNSEPELIQVYRETGDFFFNFHAGLKALEYYQKAYNLAKGDDADELLEKIGYCYYNLHDYKNSHDTFNRLLALLPSEALTRRLEVLSYLSGACKELNDFDRSLVYDREILMIYRQLNDYKGISVALNNIAFDHVHQENYTEAIRNFKESLTLVGQYKATGKEQADLLINIGICYQRANDFDNAITHLLGAYKLMQDDPTLITVRAELENTIAITYYYKNDYYNAELYSKNSIQSARQINNRELLQLCYYTYSQVLKAGNDFIKALDYYELHLALKDSVEKERKASEQIRSKENLELEKTEKELRLRLASEEMHEMELRRMKLEAEKKEKELDLLRKQKELEASEKERILQSLIVTRQKHEAELKNKELKSLEQEKAIKELQLKKKEAEKKEQEKEIALLEVEKDKQSEARKKAIYTSGLLAIIGLMILVGLLITRKKNTILERQKQEIKEKNDVLEQKTQEILTQTEHIILQKQVIEEKNIAITDSIQYASRIQDAVLPPVGEIRKCFSDCFILFRPRDIVSGDFYWGIRKGEKVVIAVADCTGHGVPGAFMSMLGTALLNEIAAVDNFSDAAGVLNNLRKNVIAALRQKGEEGEAQDGMDIALCIIDQETDVMHFAGANNPLYQIHDREINIIKGDRMPIGIHLRSDIPFTNHTLKVEKKDEFYIFSDGMIDQFGGPENKKFKSASLQQLLIRVHKKPFSEQQKLIEKAFDEWKGEEEQVDDVLLVGFKY